MASSDSEAELVETLVEIGLSETNFNIELPAGMLNNSISSSDEEMLLNMDMETIQAISASSVQNEIPDLTGAVFEELPPPNSPLPFKPLEKEIPKAATTTQTTGPPAKRFKVCTENEIETLFESRQAPSTKRNTSWALRIFQDWNTEIYGQAMSMEKVSHLELAAALSKFYVESRPKSAEELYHRSTLINIRAGINRHLADLQRNVDIVKDREFKKANGVLDGLLKERTRTGQSEPVQHKQIIERDDLEKISTYLSRAPSCPIILRHYVWYNLSMHFVTRGMEFHHQLRTNSFRFVNDESGEYVTLNFETQQKNWQGGLNSNSESHASEKRMYAIPTGTSTVCPVKMLKLMLEKTDKNATHLFNQYRKNAVSAPSSNEIWFTDKALSKRTFSNFLTEICRASSVVKRYTPHCVRATAIQYLNDEGFQARHIMFMSSHKSESSLRSYNRNVSTAQKKSLSTSLSAITIPVSRSPQPVSSQAVVRVPSSSIFMNENPLPLDTPAQNTNINVQTNTATPSFFASSSFSNGRHSIYLSPRLHSYRL